MADHLALTADGFVFAHPVIAETDRDKFSVNRIVAFYQQQPTSLADYFLAAWKYKTRLAAASRRRRSTVSRPRPASNAKYLATVWES